MPKIFKLISGLIQETAVMQSSAKSHSTVLPARLSSLKGYAVYSDNIQNAEPDSGLKTKQPCFLHLYD